jgi:hypothetical protein
MTTRARGRFRAAVPTGILVVGVLAAVTGPVGAAAKPHATAALYVAPKNGRAKLLGGCKTAAYSQINPAIRAAAVGDTIVVCAGTYTGSASVKVPISAKASVTVTSGALITKAISLIGEPGAVIKANGLVNGVTLLGPGSAGAVVNGITAEDAIGEGILAVETAGVRIENSTVVHNDDGGPKSAWIECQNPGQVIPNDCGEGLHLMTVTNATVLNDTVEFNSGGILLSDEFGPTSRNVIKGNLVEDNESDCGITIVGHNAHAVNAAGVPQPKIAGVYDNLIVGNSVLSNGTTGEGGGVLLAGAASYDNTISDNEIAGNGLSGVTIHEHGVDALSDDVIVDNWIGTNNITGDPGTADQLTTGIFVEKDSPKLPKITITIKNNTIAWNHYGVFDNTAGPLHLSDNTFRHVEKSLQL